MTVSGLRKRLLPYLITAGLNRDSRWGKRGKWRKFELREEGVGMLGFGDILDVDMGRMDAWTHGTVGYR